MGVRQVDWSKTKSIFIIVFLVLNVFLYSLYVNRHNEAQNVEVLGEKTIEARLKDDNISYAVLPNTIDTASYISGRVKTFVDTEFSFANQNIQIENDTHIMSTLSTPVKLRNIEDDSSFTGFLHDHVLGGTSYILWEVNREAGYAIFFQRVDTHTIYYNQNGYVKIYWNSQNEVYQYEQTMLERLEDLEQKEDILPPIQVIQALYTKGLLKTDSRIVSMKLGYSTLVQLTQTQVFAPTWEVRVKSDDGDEEFFVNAVEGKVIEIQNDLTDINDAE